MGGGQGAGDGGTRRVFYVGGEEKEEDAVGMEDKGSSVGADLEIPSLGFNGRFVGLSESQWVVQLVSWLTSPSHLL